MLFSFFSYLLIYIFLSIMKNMKFKNNKTRGSFALIVISCFGIFYLTSSSKPPPITEKDWKCIREEEFHKSADHINKTQNFGDFFQISFFDIQKTSKWIATPKLSITPKYLIMIQIRPENYNRRNIFRKTIMSSKYSKIVENGEMGFIFVCGKHMKNETVNRKLREEADEFADILITEIDDSYESLPFKVLSSLLYAISFEKVQIIGKYDEDVLSYPDQIAHFFENHHNLTTNSVTLFGEFLNINAPVNHNPNEQFYVPLNSYKCKYYVPYIAGPIYFMTRLAAKKILDISKHRKFISVEDCLIAGLFAMDINAEMVKIPQMFKLKESTIESDTSQLFS